MKKHILWGMALVAVSLSVASSAPAHAAPAHSWYWSKDLAEGSIYSWGAYPAKPWLDRTHFGYMARRDYVRIAHCKGYGSHIRAEQGPWFDYQHFNCMIYSGVGWGDWAGRYSYHVRLHVLGKWRFRTVLVTKCRSDVTRWCGR